MHHLRKRELFNNIGFLCRLGDNALNHKQSTTANDKFSLPEQYRGSEDNVWVEFLKLADKYKPLRLDIGYPDFLPPEHVTKALVEAVTSPNVAANQYTRSFGHPRLISAISKQYSKLLNREIVPQTEVLITVGAQQALSSAILGHLKKGDEAIIIEPYYDSYAPLIKTAGAKAISIPLKISKKSGQLSSSDFVLDKEELTKCFNERTKMIILNTPHNPLGKVFTLEELEMIADLCKKWDVMCLSDEVYEWLVYKPNKHIRIASLPGMWERTITIGSAGKTFNVTGWKIGWAYGPANLIYNLQIVHQNYVYVCSTPLQEAVAQSLETEFELLGTPECFFEILRCQLEKKRETLTDVLTEVGLRPIYPQGGYFIISDWSPLEGKVQLSEDDGAYKDYRFAKWMTKNVGIQGIPPSAFYSKPNKHLGENLIRLCFIKQDANLQKAAELLRKWKNTTA